MSCLPGWCFLPQLELDPHTFVVLEGCNPQGSFSYHVPLMLGAIGTHFRFAVKAAELGKAAL